MLLIDPSSIIGDLSLEVGSVKVASTWRVTGGGVEIDLEDSVFVRRGIETDMALKIEISEKPSVNLFALRIPADENIYCTDVLTDAGVPVEPAEGLEFPFVSDNAAVLMKDIRSSFTNYPNPFTAGRESTRITFYMPDDGRVTLRVFTLTGAGVKTIIDNEYLTRGLYQDYYWDGRNGKGMDVLNGVYYLVLDVTTSDGTHRYMRKVAVVR